MLALCGCSDTPATQSTPAGSPIAEETSATPHLVTGAASIAFDALRSNESRTLETLMLRREDIDWLAKTLTYSAKKKKAVLGQLRRIREGFLTSIEKARERSAGDFDWRTAKFDGVDSARTKMSDRDGVVRGDACFWVVAGGQRYSFALKKLARVGRGWVCVGLLYHGAQEEGG